MFSADIPVASEIATSLNFLVFDILLIALIMHITSRISGMCNHSRVRQVDEISLLPFSVPHIGGGIVMKSGRSRILLILLRISAIVAMFLSNFGLQGRSTILAERDVTVRRPGSLTNLTIERLFNASEAQKQCGGSVDGEIRFRSVIDGVCYDNYTAGVYVKTLALSYEDIVVAMGECKETPVRERIVSILQCENAELVCSGPFLDGSPISYESCEGIAYVNDEAWTCDSQRLRGNVASEQSVRCRKIGVRREDITDWTNIYAWIREDLVTAVFGAAYAVKTRTRMKVPVYDVNITTINLWWVIPTSWMIFVAAGVTVWMLVLYYNGARPIACDEKSLLNMLKSSSKSGYETASDGLEVGWR